MKQTENNICCSKRRSHMGRVVKE